MAQSITVDAKCGNVTITLPVHPDPSFNRNVNGGKRPNKGIQKYGRYKTIADRFAAELEARWQYELRVKNNKIP